MPLNAMIKNSVMSTVLVASHINHSALVSWQDLQKLHVIPKSFPVVAAAVSVYNDIKNKNNSCYSLSLLRHFGQQTNVC